MVKGKTTSGIRFAIDENIKNDTRVLFYSTKMQKKGISQVEQSEALFGLLQIVFGTEDNLVLFMDEVAKKNGNCAPETLMKEVSEIFEALNIKKS